MNKTVDSATIEVAAGIVEQALNSMRTCRIPPTPQNLTVWYHHIEGTVPQLSKELDQLLARQIKFTQELNHQLHDRYFVDSDRRQLDLLREAVGSIIARMSEQVINDVSEELETYHSELVSCSEKLEEIPNALDLKMLVDILAKASNHARQTTTTAQKDIAKMQSELTELRAAFDELERHAMEDALTGVANRRAFDQALREQLLEAQSSQAPCCLLLVDVDRFKAFNDTYGHLTGDKVLRFVALMLKRMIKGRDIIARYGGEEFAIILPQTGFEGGMSLAKSIVASIAKTRLVVGEKQETLDPITVSIGMTCSLEGDIAEAFFSRADAAVYQAKDAGRNQAVGA